MIHINNSDFSSQRKKIKVVRYHDSKGWCMFMHFTKSSVIRDVCQPVEEKFKDSAHNNIFLELPCANSGSPCRFGWPVNRRSVCVCSWWGHSTELQTDLGSAPHSWKINMRYHQYMTLFVPQQVEPFDIWSQSVDQCLPSSSGCCDICSCFELRPFCRNKKATDTHCRLLWK